MEGKDYGGMVRRSGGDKRDERDWLEGLEERVDSTLCHRSRM